MDAGDSSAHLGRKDLLILILVAAAYTAATTFLSYLRYENFYTSNWDLGIAMQALWTTTHGYLMYDTGDFTNLGVHSYLGVNSAFIGIPLSFLYQLIPSAVTLFSIQSAVIALSSIPLFMIASTSMRSRSHAYLLVAVYLSGFALLSGLLYDFHWEAFIPLEYFSFYYLLARRRLVLSLIPFAAGALTLQVFPALAGGVLLLLLIGSLRHREDTERRWLIALAAYAVLVAATFLAVDALQSAVASPVGSFPFSSTPLHTAESFIFPLRLSLVDSTVYWLLLLASAGFLPLLSPRHLVLSLPWFIESVFLASRFSVSFGAQYSMIALPPLFVAAVAGLSRIRSRKVGTPSLIAPSICAVSSLVLLATGYSASLLNPDMTLQVAIIIVLSLLALSILVYSSSFSVRYALRESSKIRKLRGVPAIQVRTVITALLLSLLLFNLVMSPLNTENFAAAQYPGYTFRYSTNPAFAQLGRVVDLIPAGSVVVVSNNLMPYIADNPNAYSMMWKPFSYRFLPDFPFNSTNLPTFVLVDSSEITLLSPAIEETLFNSTIYGLVSYIYQPSYPGTIYLFQKGYSLPPTEIVAVPQPSTYYFNYRNLVVGLSGHVVANRTSMFGHVIESTDGRLTAPSNVNNAAIWYGPYLTFLPGAYRVTMSLSGTGPSGSALLFVNSNGSGGPYYYESTITASQMNGSGWSNITFTINITEPYFLTEFRGYLQYNGSIPAGTVSLNYIKLQKL